MIPELLQNLTDQLMIWVAGKVQRLFSYNVYNLMCIIICIIFSLFEMSQGFCFDLICFFF